VPGEFEFEREVRLEPGATVLSAVSQLGARVLIGPNGTILLHLDPDRPNSHRLVPGSALLGCQGLGLNSSMLRDPICFPSSSAASTDRGKSAKLLLVPPYLGTVAVSVAPATGATLAGLQLKPIDLVFSKSLGYSLPALGLQIARDRVQCLLAVGGASLIGLQRLPPLPAGLNLAATCILSIEPVTSSKISRPLWTPPEVRSWWQGKPFEARPPWVSTAAHINGVILSKIHRKQAPAIPSPVTCYSLDIIGDFASDFSMPSRRAQAALRADADTFLFLRDMTAIAARAGCASSAPALAASWGHTPSPLQAMLFTRSAQAKRSLLRRLRSVIRDRVLQAATSPPGPAATEEMLGFQRALGLPTSQARSKLQHAISLAKLPLCSPPLSELRLDRPSSLTSFLASLHAEGVVHPLVGHGLPSVPAYSSEMRVATSLRRCLCAPSDRPRAHLSPALQVSLSRAGYYAPFPPTAACSLARGEAGHSCVSSTTASDMAQCSACSMWFHRPCQGWVSTPGTTPLRCTVCLREVYGAVCARETAIHALLQGLGRMDLAMSLLTCAFTDSPTLSCGSWSIPSPFRTRDLGELLPLRDKLKVTQSMAMALLEAFAALRGSQWGEISESTLLLLCECFFAARISPDEAADATGRALDTIVSNLPSSEPDLGAWASACFSSFHPLYRAGIEHLACTLVASTRLDIPGCVLTMESLLDPARPPQRTRPTALPEIGSLYFPGFAALFQASSVPPRTFLVSELAETVSPAKSPTVAELLTHSVGSDGLGFVIDWAVAANGAGAPATEGGVLARPSPFFGLDPLMVAAMSDQAHFLRPIVQLDPSLLLAVSLCRRAIVLSPGIQAVLPRLQHTPSPPTLVDFVVLALALNSPLASHSYSMAMEAVCMSLAGTTNREAVVKQGWKLLPTGELLDSPVMDLLATEVVSDLTAAAKALLSADLTANVLPRAHRGGTLVVPLDLGVHFRFPMDIKDPPDHPHAPRERSWNQEFLELESRLARACAAHAIEARSLVASQLLVWWLSQPNRREDSTDVPVQEALVDLSRVPLAPEHQTLLKAACEYACFMAARFGAPIERLCPFSSLVATSAKDPTSFPSTLVQAALHFVARDTHFPHEELGVPDILTIEPSMLFRGCANKTLRSLSEMGMQLACHIAQQVLTQPTSTDPTALFARIQQTVLASHFPVGIEQFRSFLALCQCCMVLASQTRPARFEYLRCLSSLHEACDRLGITPQLVMEACAPTPLAARMFDLDSRRRDELSHPLTRLGVSPHNPRRTEGVTIPLLSEEAEREYLNLLASNPSLQSLSLEDRIHHLPHALKEHMRRVHRIRTLFSHQSVLSMSAVRRAFSDQNGVPEVLVLAASRFSPERWAGSAVIDSRFSNAWKLTEALASLGSMLDLERGRISRRIADGGASALCHGLILSPAAQPAPDLPPHVDLGRMSAVEDLLGTLSSITESSPTDLASMAQTVYDTRTVAPVDSRWCTGVIANSSSRPREFSRKLSMSVSKGSAMPGSECARPGCHALCAAGSRYCSPSCGTLVAQATIAASLLGESPSADAAPSVTKGTPPMRLLRRRRPARVVRPPPQDAWTRLSQLVWACELAQRLREMLRQVARLPRRKPPPAPTFVPTESHMPPVQQTWCAACHKLVSASHIGRHLDRCGADAGTQTVVPQPFPVVPAPMIVAAPSGTPFRLQLQCLDPPRPVRFHTSRASKRSSSTLTVCGCPLGLKPLVVPLRGSSDWLRWHAPTPSHWAFDVGHLSDSTSPAFAKLMADLDVTGAAWDTWERCQVKQGECELHATWMQGMARIAADAEAAAVGSIRLLIESHATIANPELLPEDLVAAPAETACLVVELVPRTDTKEDEPLAIKRELEESQESVAKRAKLSGPLVHSPSEALPCE
jgi:hypothetical protein